MAEHGGEAGDGGGRGAPIRAPIAAPYLYNPLPSVSSQYRYKGNTVTGKIFKKSPNSTRGNALWIVTPSDRRRKNEDIPEKELGKVITKTDHCQGDSNNKCRVERYLLP